MNTKKTNTKRNSESRDTSLSPRTVIKNYKASKYVPLYLVGAFDSNVTVLSQQIRALNLAWALVESKTIPSKAQHTPKLAIIGAGFAGLTLAAALLRKRAALDITIFEQRDTMLPLQQGSDSRWLHPQIYDWPAEGSEASAAMLPVLNWTAGRASDVVVQTLNAWRRVIKEEDPKENKIHLFCNTRHLQIERCTEDHKKMQIEWVGERRESSNGTTKFGEVPEGSSDSFDFVVMTVGFGLELEAASSYWRNETLGQPSLSQARATYLVSGQGDGAMIDLLRLRISEYRQDRILDELFSGKKELLEELKYICTNFSKNKSGTTLFQRFEDLCATNNIVTKQFKSLLQELKNRLRRDTDAILHLKVRNLANLFDSKISRMSFQNALLVYILYKCGGFVPSTEEEKSLITRLSINPEHVVRRYGPNRHEIFTRILSKSLYRPIKIDQAPRGSHRLHQEAEIRWSGGYFGIPGPLSKIKLVPDSQRKTWRKEYLPGPTALLSTALCGAVAGAIARLAPEADHFRVTLHRVINIHKEELFQQSCEYQGRGLISGPSASGRTFPTSNATIGQAYACRSIVRSRRGVSRQTLRNGMNHLKLNDASSKMANEVGFVLAIPILQPLKSFFRPSPVAGIFYVDSKSPKFWLSNGDVSELCTVIQQALNGLQNGQTGLFDRLRNFQLSDIETEATRPRHLPGAVARQLELVHVPAPFTASAFHFNFDHSDLTPLESL